MAKASRSLVDLHDPVPAHAVLESFRRRIDGGEVAVGTRRRKRNVLEHVPHYAVGRGELGARPLAKVRWRLPKAAVSVDPWVVADPHQARDLLTAMSYVGDTGGYLHLKQSALTDVAASDMPEYLLVVIHGRPCPLRGGSPSGQ